MCKHIFWHFFKNFSVLAGGCCPPDPLVFGWGDKAPPDPLLKRSFVTFDRGGQTGPLRSNDFFFRRRWRHSRRPDFRWQHLYGFLPGARLPKDRNNWQKKHFQILCMISRNQAKVCLMVQKSAKACAWLSGQSSWHLAWQHQHKQCSVFYIIHIGWRRAPPYWYTVNA